MPFVAPEDVFRNVPVSILAPAFPDFAYPYELFENSSSIRSSRELETALNSCFPLHYDPAPSSFSPQPISPVNNAAGPWTIYSAPVPLWLPTPAPSQKTTGCPFNWRKIPQTVYGWGKKQSGYQPSEPILFHVDGRPGVNMGDALRNVFTGLDGRDDPIFQDAGKSFSCRLMVRSLRQLPPPRRTDGPVRSSPGTRSTVNRR